MCKLLPNRGWPNVEGEHSGNRTPHRIIARARRGCASAALPARLLRRRKTSRITARARHSADAHRRIHDHVGRRPYYRHRLRMKCPVRSQRGFGRRRPSSRYAGDVPTGRALVRTGRLGLPPRCLHPPIPPYRRGVNEKRLSSYLAGRRDLNLRAPGNTTTTGRTARGNIRTFGLLQLPAPSIELRAELPSCADALFGPAKGEMDIRDIDLYRPFFSDLILRRANCLERSESLGAPNAEENEPYNIHHRGSTCRPSELLSRPGLFEGEKSTAKTRLRTTHQASRIPTGPDFHRHLDAPRRQQRDANWPADGVYCVDFLLLSYFLRSS